MVSYNVDTLLHAKERKDFPPTRMGKNWLDHFVQQHHARIQQLWSFSPEPAHGWAVNEHTNSAWFNLPDNTIQTHKIECNCIWAANETGFQPGRGLSRQVIGAAKNKFSISNVMETKKTSLWWLQSVLMVRRSLWP